MADRYWVGGTGNWSDATNHWSDSSGGSPNASFLPGTGDNAYFDGSSDTGAGFTVTINTASNCANLIIGDGTIVSVLDQNMVLTGTAALNVYGSVYYPATRLTCSYTGDMTFRATTTGKTITTNGVTLTTGITTFNGVNGEWTLVGALTAGNGSGKEINLTAGSLVTNNYNMTMHRFVSTSGTTRSLTLGSSTVTCNNNAVTWNVTSTNFTFNAETSQINSNVGNSAASFYGGGLTYYNVSFLNTTLNYVEILGVNTFNNLTFTARTNDGIGLIYFYANQTINGTLTLGSGTTGVRRLFLFSDTIGTQRTLNVNAVSASPTDIDFRDINLTGNVISGGNLSGTRFGNCGNNTGIAFDAPKVVYWNLAGSQNWSAVGWAATNNGAPASTNFPLAQDTATFTEAGSAGTVTVNTAWNIGSIQMADGVSNRTTAFTLATGTTTPSIYGNVTLFSSLTLTGTGMITFAGNGVTQTITTAGITFTQPITIATLSGTFKLADNFTTSFAGISYLTLGTFDLNNKTFACVRFNTNNSNIRSILFGTTGAINITSTGGTVNLIVWDAQTLTNFSYTGISSVNFTGNATTQNRRCLHGASAGGSESNAINFNITAGSDTFNLSGAIKNLTFSGYTGNFEAEFSTGALTLYGNLTFVTGMTANSTLTRTLTLSSTSGTQSITTAGVTFGWQQVLFSGTATYKLIDNFTHTWGGGTGTTTFTSGTLDLNDKTYSSQTFVTNNSNVRSVLFGTTGSVKVTGNNTTVWNSTTVTNFSYTGTSNVEFSYSGSTGTRTIILGLPLEANSLNVKISAGTDIVAVSTNIKNLDFTGFSGTFSNSARTLYGNLTLAAGMTLTAGANTTTFAATSGTQQITSNGKTMDFPITVNAPGATVQCQDALTQGSTRAFTFTAGTLQFKNGVTSTTGSFVASSATLKYLQSASAGAVATLSQTSGTNNLQNMQIKDITATGGAVWNAVNGAISYGNNTGWYFAHQQRSLAPALATL